MKHFIKGLFILTIFFSCIGSAAYASNSLNPRNQTKLYFDSNDLEIDNNAIYIHSENAWIETNVIRTDEQGFYIFEEDVIEYDINGKGWVKKWKCPYCFQLWPIGEPCQNPECPSKY